MSRPLILTPFARSIGNASYFAARVHEGQVDKSGEPYIDHLRRVFVATHYKLLLWCQEDSLAYNEGCQIAWLHDVIEDTPYSAEHLLHEGFSRSVVEGVEMLSSPGTVYLKWIAHIAARAPIEVLLVKLSDNEDNADPGRLAKLDEATRTRLITKYEPSMAMLREAVRSKGWRG